jgi:osmotically-inducible protein OsmY
MADRDRYRDDQNRYRYRDEYGYGRGREWSEPAGGGRRGNYYGPGGDRGRREDDGFIARRGFGNESAGFDRDRDRERGYDTRYSSGRERDFGDSAGYGTGGSTRDWRDVTGDEQSRGTGYRSGYEWNRDRGYGGRGAGSSYGGDYGRYGSSDFGRGSRGEDDERGFFERAGDEVRSWFGDEDAERRRERDARRDEYGSNRGRGPKNYTRSDDRIREDINDRLTDDPRIDASEIEVTVSAREVTLDGTVDSRFEKRFAEDLAEAVSGVSHVQNNLRLRQHALEGQSGTGVGGSPLGTTTSGNAGTSLGTNATSGTAGRRSSSSTAST